MMEFIYLFTANMPDGIPHLGLQIVMISKVYYIHSSLISISCCYPGGNVLHLFLLFKLLQGFKHSLRWYKGQRGNLSGMILSFSKLVEICPTGKCAIP